MAVQASRLCAVLSGAIVSGTLSVTAIAGDEWPMGGQNLQNSRSQSTTTITPENVGSLKQKWVFTTGGNVSATPAVYQGTVYFPDWAGNFYAVDAKTGALVWSQTVSSWTGVSGDYARDDPAIDGDTLILGDQAGALSTWSKAGGLAGAGARVIAVNRLTGDLIWSRQVYSFPTGFIIGSPVIYKGVVYVGVASWEEHTAAQSGYPCCASSGSVVALGLEHGKILWQTYMSPSGYSGGSVWGSTPVIDAARNSVYVGVGNNFSVPQAVEACFANNQNDPDCAASNDYFNSDVALDLTTGQVKWSARGLNYDAWNIACVKDAAGVGNCPSPKGPDYDFGGSGPNMLGSNLVGIGQKSGVYWALDPDDGSLVWQTQVGPPGILWGTAFDGTSIYVPISNADYASYTLQSGGAQVNGGLWAALNPSSGQNSLADRNARRMFAVGFRLRAGLQGPWAGKRRQRRRVRRLDGHKPTKPHDVRPQRGDRTSAVVVRRGKLGQRGA